MGKALGVDEKWVCNIIKQVGNYGESFDKHVGPNSLLKIDRGVEQAVDAGRSAIRSADPLIQGV